MNKEQAIIYLKNVITNWDVFCEEHTRFALAIKVILDYIDSIED